MTRTIADDSDDEASKCSSDDVRRRLYVMLVAYALAACRTDGEKPAPRGSLAPEPPTVPSQPSVVVDAASAPLVAEPPDAGALPCVPEGPRRVSEISGDLFLCEPGEAARRLTTDGQNFSPALAPDGRRVVFMRAAGKQRLSLGSSSFVEIHDNRVMLLDLRGGGPKEIAKNDERSGCTSLWSPWFADDGAIVVVSNGYEEATVHNHAVCALDLSARGLALLGRGTRCTIFISVGKYRGDFYVSTIEIHPTQGQIAPTKIVDRRGRVVRLLDGNPFIQDWNGDGAI
jgi:hypothetical protein